MLLLNLQNLESTELTSTISHIFGNSNTIIVESSSLGSRETAQISEIKRHFDKLVLLRGKLPRTNEEIDHLFGMGFHGIIISADDATTALAEHAVSIFKNGYVFAEITTSMKITKLVPKLIAHGIVPILGNSTKEEAILFNTLLSRSDYLFQSKVITATSDSFKMVDRIRLKFIIEMINLRQKLMVTEINESFESSSL